MFRSLNRARAVWALFICGCAGPSGQAFLSAKDRGDRAYSAGRYREAAAAYGEASQRAGRARDRAEGLYLEGSAYARSGAKQRAREVLERLVTELPTTERATRASFDLADLQIDDGDEAHGYAVLEAAMMKYPNDGLARRALERRVAWMEQRSADPLNWLRELLPRVAATELDETARYLLADQLEKASRDEEARAAYVECAHRHPYPTGSLFDDALWHASLIDERLGRPKDAIQDLRRMLAVREESTFAGSYERPRFSPAQFRIAVLYRDALHDPANARREFHRLYVEHTTSILRDDALWQEAKLAAGAGDARGACALVGTLAREFKDSRFVPCATSLCPSAPAPLPGRKCHDYILRDETPEKAPKED